MQLEKAALLQRADSMFPEGLGHARAVRKDGAAAPRLNALLVNGKGAIDDLWTARGYVSLRPEQIKQRLGYALDREEALGYVVTSALNMPLLASYEARVVGKRIGSAPLDASGSIGKQLRRKGAAQA